MKILELIIIHCKPVEYSSFEKTQKCDMTGFFLDLIQKDNIKLAELLINNTNIRIDLEKINEILERRKLVISHKNNYKQIHNLI